MNSQQAVPPRSSANGFSRRRVDRELGERTENKMNCTKSTSSGFGNAGLSSGSKVGGCTGPSHDRLIYVMMHLIGHRVEVHVKNGSVISGIFHAADVDKDFGIVLKMAQVTKDGTVRGQKPFPDTVKRPQTVIIPARELVQVLAKEINLSSDESVNGHARDKRKDFMIDSAISHSHHVEERELERWTPDEDDPECPELEDIFDGTRNRNWDQFETNKTLFGVKSTFSEELYTTKLERGPRMREIEREAARIAREMEGEQTEDLHLAEERGNYFDGDLDLDEETKYSAVRREIDVGRFPGNEKSHADGHSSGTVGVGLGSLSTSTYVGSFSRKANNETQESSTSSSVEDESSSQLSADKNDFLIDSTYHASQQESDCIAKKPLSMDKESRLDKKQIRDHCGKMSVIPSEETAHSNEGKPSICEVELPLADLKGLPSSSVEYDSSSGQGNKLPENEFSDSTTSGKLSVSTVPVNYSLQPGSCTQSTSDCVGATSVLGGTGISPSSSMGSFSSEKSTSNSSAKEFKLNPNAKSFTPSASFRPPAPVSDGSLYYTSNIPSVPHMPGLPVGMGIGASFGGHQPVYNPQAAQIPSPQGYIPPNAPMFGQQVILGQHRPVYYMPTYPQMAPYGGRNS
ncbi:polyadenylate-binding protein-interacting protein 3-like [Typha angustifolia]|uniref:polyadenylate-binding protein-interacting protein 3-like n=1 Tax=Typha angustifolia TaxID=59011 RepID=UPI003C2D244E